MRTGTRGDVTRPVLVGLHLPGIIEESSNVSRTYVVGRIKARCTRLLGVNRRMMHDEECPAGADKLYEPALCLIVLGPPTAQRRILRGNQVERGSVQLNVKEASMQPSDRYASRLGVRRRSLQCDLRDI